MNETEKRVNRDRLARGLPADFETRESAMHPDYEKAMIHKAVRLAMDAATADLLEREKALRAVERELPAFAAAEDEADAKSVYLAAMKFMGVDIEPLQESNAPGLAAIFQLMVQAVKKPGSTGIAHALGQDTAKSRARMAADSKSFIDRFPNAARIRKA